jgi:hypothetical protein
MRGAVNGGVIGTAISSRAMKKGTEHGSEVTGSVAIMDSAELSRALWRRS